MIQPIMNDALIKALDVQPLDIHARKLHHLLADATLLVRGNEVDDDYQFDLVAANDGSQALVLDTYTNWAELTGDETVFPIRFTTLLTSMMQTDVIQGIQINQKHVFPKSVFVEKQRTLLAPIDEADNYDSQLEEQLAPWLEKHVKRAYLGKLIQNNVVEYALLLQPGDEHLNQNLSDFWKNYQKENPTVPDLQLVQEDSETAQFMLEHFIPIYAAK